MPLAPHGKKLIAHAMFHKGKQFLGAAALLDQENGYRDVVLHLICQGIEVIQKGLLLARDYDRYKPNLKTISHNLVKGSDELHIAYKLKPLKKEVRDELQKLNNCYCRHLLRYGNIHDILGSTKTLTLQTVMKHTVAMVIFGNKVFLKMK